MTTFAVYVIPMFYQAQSTEDNVIDELMYLIIIENGLIIELEQKTIDGLLH